MRRAAPRHKARGAGITSHVGRNCKGRRPGATALYESGPKARSLRSKDKLCHMAQIRPEARSHREADRPTWGG